MKKIKVLHLIDSIGLGGAQRIMGGILKSKSDRIQNYGFVLRDTINPMDISGVQIFESKNRFAFKPLPTIIKLIKEKNIDVLHCHLFRSQVFGWIIKSFYCPNIKLIFHEHGQIYNNEHWYKYLMKAMSKKVDLFIAISDDTYKKLINKGEINKNKIKTVINFVHIKLTVKKVKPKSPHVFTIGFTGRLHKQKGCEHLIRALRYLDFPFKAIIAGAGPEMQNLKSLTRQLTLTSKVEFVGFVKNIDRIYSALDLLIFPSEWEAFGLSAMEGQYSGVPVIASNTGGIPEFIQNEYNGLLFEPKNVRELSDKIKKVYYDSKLRKKLVENGKKTTRNYSLDQYLKQMNKVYIKI